MHKETSPVRPILSAIGIYNYKLAKFLVPPLKPYTCNHYTVTDSSFANEISSLPNQSLMASFDISGLFTNIPLIEAIDISTNLLDLLFYDCEFVYYNGCKFDKNNFCNSLSFVVNDNYFLFNYVQIDGIDMGSSLIKYFLNKQFHPVSSQDKETSKHIVMLSLPSIGSYSTVIRNNVNQLLKKHFPDCKLHIFFKPAVCLTPLFKPKDHFFLIHKDRYTLNSQQSSTPLVLFKYSMFFSYTVFPVFIYVLFHTLFVS